MITSKELTMMRQYLRGTGIPHRETSGIRVPMPGKITRHSFPGTNGIGLAQDAAGPKPGRDTPELLRIFNELWKIRGSLRELYLSHPQVTHMVRQGALVPRSRIPRSILDAHHDHVHWSVEKGTFLVYRPTLEEASEMIGKPAVSIIMHPKGKGYWVVAADGGVFPFFGEAVNDAEDSKWFFGSLGDTKLNAPIVDAEASPSGKGYLLVSEDGGVFAFGDVEFRGSAVKWIR